MSSSRPLFSIITVTYNAQSTIARTMDSVKAQTCQLFEHIIMDGASKDDTLKIVKEKGSDRTVVFSEPDNGLYDAMNKSLGKATGDYLIFLNAGDSFHSKDTLQILADAILDNDYPGIVYGQTALVNGAGEYVGERHLLAPENLSFDSFKNGMSVCHQAFTVLRRIAPLYDTRFRFSADYDWCIRCLLHSRSTVYVGETTIDYLYEGLTTKNRKASLKERFKIMAHYYGFIPTLLRHIQFLFRFIKRQKVEKEFK